MSFVPSFAWVCLNILTRLWMTNWKMFIGRRIKESRLTRQSAMESMTLLKNDGILPLRKDKIKKIAVIGPHADNARMFFWRLYAHIYDGIYLCGGEQYCRGCRD